MIQSNRIPPAAYRQQETVRVPRRNTADKQNSVYKKNITVSKQSVKKESGKLRNSQTAKSKNNNNRRNFKSEPRSNVKNASTVSPHNIQKKSPVKRKQTVEEIALRKQKQEAYKRKQALYKKKLHEYNIKLFKNRLRIFFNRFILFAFMFLLVFLTWIVLFFINLLNNGSPDSGVYTYQTGSIYDVVDVKTVKGNLVFRNGTYYINVTDIASYCEFTTTGDVSQIRFISKSPGNDNVRFKIGESIIYVNGICARLSVPIIGEGDSIYVPVEFFYKYAIGISVIIDEEKRQIIISRTFDDPTSTVISEFEMENLLRESKNEEPIDISELSVDIGYGDIAFTLRQNEPTEHIDEYTIGRDLFLITDPEYIAGLKKLAEENKLQTE